MFVIFGAAGDLTKRLLVPALCNLRRAKLLPEVFALIGVDRANKNDQSFHQDLGASLREFSDGEISAADWQWLASRMRYLRGEFDDSALYAALSRHLADIGKDQQNGGNCLFYLATPPKLFAPIVRHLAESGLTREEAGSWRHVVIEKPFGRDLHSAQQLNRELLGVLNEDQIYRIDHYLGKETVQNILIFRFSNGMFEPVWNRHHIDHVQITVAETLGVEQRGKSYDATGALRDMVPSHLCQLLALTAMEPPVCCSANALRTEKTKVLDAVRELCPEDAWRNAVRGQYGAGKVAGKEMVAYRCSPGVAPDSAALAKT